MLREFLSSLLCVSEKAANIARSLDLDDRIDVFSRQSPFLSVKDHKPGFPSRVATRLINPAKSQICKISKQLLNRIISQVKAKTRLSSWKSSSHVLDWFHSASDKQLLHFFRFDIVSYYPSITEKLFNDALEFAGNYTNISESDKKILLNARQQVLLWEGDTWEKKESRFDVTMGAFDGAEICDLVGLFALHKIKQKLPAEAVGLYRDDGLGLTRRAGRGGLIIERELHKTFNELGLKLTVEVNLKRVDFLDAILDLSSGTTSSYRKPNDTPRYINIHSSHPPSVIKQIPKMVSDRISSLSSNKEAYDRAIPVYKEALSAAGHKTESVVFTAINRQAARSKNRSRNIRWFNPPYNAAVETNITNLFHSIIDRAFPKDHPYLSKLFNKRNMKLSYSTTPNLKSIIASHNRHLLANHQPVPNRGNHALVQRPPPPPPPLGPLPQPDQHPPGRTCNCRIKANCPLAGQCLIEGVVYRAEISTNEPNDSRFYIGSTGLLFKTRFNGHHSSLTNEKYKNETTLSTYAWDLKDQGKVPSIKWSIVAKVAPYRPGSGHCPLCTAEKTEIASHIRDKKCLNKRSELLAKCRHRRKFLLSSVPEG